MLVKLKPAESLLINGSAYSRRSLKSIKFCTFEDTKFPCLKFFYLGKFLEAIEMMRRTQTKTEVSRVENLLQNLRFKKFSRLNISIKQIHFKKIYCMRSNLASKLLQ